MDNSIIDLICNGHDDCREFAVAVVRQLREKLLIEFENEDDEEYMFVQENWRNWNFMIDMAKSCAQLEELFPTTALLLYALSQYTTLQTSTATTLRDPARRRFFTERWVPFAKKQKEILFTFPGEIDATHNLRTYVNTLTEAWLAQALP